MEICCKSVRFSFVLFFGAFLLASNVFAQVNIGIVDPGPYTPGSTIAVPFQVPSSCTTQGNQFQLYLSDQNGSFAAESLIGSYTGFYSTYVNGLLPTNLTPGTGYRVRVKTTLPTSVSAASTPFEVKAGAAVEAKLTSTYLNNNNRETFGTCMSKPNNSFLISNESTANSNVTATVTDQGSGGSTTTLSFPTPIQSFTAQQSHYTIYAKAVMPDGSVATKAYLLINNKTITAFANTGNTVVCLPLGALTFSVDVTSASGIQNNFPGNIYTINWGDQSTTTYTLCDIINNGGTVTHSYIKSSCGSVSTSSAGTIFNAFDVSINVSNTFCGIIGTPVSSSAKVVVKPENSFAFNSPGCTNADITFVNTSTLGENPNTNTIGCAPNEVTYNWYVDGVPVKANQPRSYNLVHKFTTRGEHVIRLESNTSGACNADPVEMKICIQDPPKPDFSLPSSTICAGSTLKATDLSVLDNICGAANNYSWSVSPTVSFVGGTNAASKEPVFSFPTAGTYTITLSISTPSCGLITSQPQTVVVNESPKATLSPDIILCNLAVYDFNNTTTGPTKTLITGTIKDLPDTYTWTVVPSGTGTYSFTNGTTANSKYPSIKFDSYDTYTIKVVHKNNCGTAEDTQVITFSTAPVVNAGPDQSICFNDQSFTLNGMVTGTTTTQTWVGGQGTFTPNRNDLNAVYTPTLTEKRAGIVTLTLRVTTSLAAPCNQIDDEIILKIKPDISLTSAATKTICTGNSVAYTPTSAVAGVTYTWTATGTPSVAGYTVNGTGDINDVLTNTDINADASVTYTITPNFDGCNGTPFNLLVTVKPNPIVAATSASSTICNKTSSAINLSGNFAGVNYTYSSAVTGSITGNSNRSVASAETQISDILTNSGTTSGSVTYTITPVSTNGCPGTPINITITVLPSATPASAGIDEAICNTGTYTLKGNDPIVGTGKWTTVTAPTAVTFADDTQGNTTITGLQAGNTYTFRWTISDTNCSTSSDDVQITVNPLSIGGTTTGDASVCAGSNGGNINLAGQVGNIVRWERSIDNGINWSTITSTANPYVFTNLTITTQYRAVVQSGSCAEAFSTVTTITVNPGTVVANAGPDQNLCTGSSINLNGNNPAPNSGAWTIVSAQTGVVITDPNLYNTTVTGLVPGETYTFKWTITGFGACPPSTDDITITYYPLVTNNISASAAPTCSGQNITINGDVPTGGTGTYAYQWQSSADGNTWANIPSAINRDLTITATASSYFRRVVNSTSCPSFSNSVQITVLPALTNNTISADQNICIGTAAAALTGTTPSGGSGSYTYQWQSSLNGTDWSDVLGANSLNFTPPTPTASIYYRRSVASGVCDNSLSNQIKITVNPNAKAEITYNTNTGCAPFKLDASNIAATLYPDRNSVYTWFANNVQIGVGATFPGYTITNGNESVTIKLVVTSSLGCNQDEKSEVFSTFPSVTPSFTQSATEGCGPLSVTFTNTTNPLNSATYVWDFGNGQTSTLAQPAAITFQADPTGKDKTYNITLTTTLPCGVPVITTATVIVHAKPVAIFSPDKTTGCADLLVNFINTSPESAGTTYTYDFGDGTSSGPITDRNTISHTFKTLVVRDFIVNMTAKNSCGETNATPVVIRVSPNDITPALVVNGNEKKGCAPWTVNFLNNTSGASRYVYTITNEDSGEAPVVIPTTNTGVFPYTFLKAGQYTIRLDAENDCSKNSATETVTVLAQPTVSFSADKTIGCTNLVVKFKNTSVGAIGYTWDFGDGSPISNEFEPQHTYTGSDINYSVTLTAINALDCSQAVTKTDFIRIVAPPVATFTVSPGNEISVPNYTFGFTDISAGSVSWEWSFGDGAKSTLQNPNHTYANEGTYNVTLKVLNKEGCSSTTFQFVKIISVPGNLNIPNSFMPASAKNEIKIFKAKGRGIKEWNMSVFNKWGELLWETTKLDDGAPLEGWDGTYKGQEQPQGVYYWKVDVKFINGSEWKGMTYDSSPARKTGVIYLIR
ncbi:PKD domain-containing protein [Pedobacter sp. PF22-3]|uniref:PKD domain-containing protein n=1 Tax=Pedobacter sp. PF22-3 TaxID=2994467 RepID=UPI00224599E8|nr:PKD domain-containing protein [Pedobacter sp. PF22-3]MCX2493696.1 PKD domain-containing protein [Pedobacter sp. PF22-3]